MVQVHMTFAQRKSSPSSPEVICAWDEYCMDENPEGYQRDLEEQISSWGDEMLNHATLVLDIPYDAVMRALNPPLPKFTVTWERGD